MEIFVENCTRIIRKTDEGTFNFFLSANPHSGHISIEDGFDRVCVVDVEVIPDIIAELQKLHAGILEFKRNEALEKIRKKDQEFNEKMSAEVGGPNV